MDKHNYRKYDNEQDDIVIVRETSPLYNDEIVEISDAEELEKVIKIIYNNTHGNKE